MADIPDDIFNYSTLNEDFTYDVSEGYEDHVNLPLAIIYFVLSVIGLGLNTLVICIFLRHEKMRTISNVYIFNLATGDALHLLGLLLLATQLATHSWPFGVFWCKSVLTVEFLSPVVAITFVMVMSIDRCVVLYRPAIANKWRQPKMAALLSAAVWAASFLYALPGALFGYVGGIPNLCIIISPSSATFHFDVYSLCRCAIGFVVPVGATALCLFMIVVKARPPVHPGQITKYKGSDRSRMPAMLFLTYILCWLPLNIYIIVSVLSDAFHFSEHHIWIAAVHVLSTAKSCINPILYWYLSEDCRQALQRALCCRKKNGTWEPVENDQGQSAC